MHEKWIAMGIPIINLFSERSFPVSCLRHSTLFRGFICAGETGFWFCLGLSDSKKFVHWWWQHAPLKGFIEI